MAFTPVKKVESKLSAAQLINQDSGNVEYYTPIKFVESARKVMGMINLDPASSEKANEKIKANLIFTKNNNGLMKPWFGNVWMNHPFSKGEKACFNRKNGEYNCKKKACKDRGYHIDHDLPGNGDWVQKLVHEYEYGGVNQAIMICFCSTSETWFKPLLNYPQCFITGRVNYYNDQGEEIKGCTKGSVITYFGDNHAAFEKEFSQYGKVK
jgi:hypothetical protein